MGEMQITTPSETEIVMTRVFDAPRDLVFEAHTSCEHMSKWWGPRRYEVAECDIDFREGGRWRVVHVGPDGERQGFGGRYIEIVRPERITWTFAWDGAPDQEGPETLTLEERDGKTILTTRSVFPSAEVRDAVLASGMSEGAAETWDRLAEYVATLASV